MDELDDRSLITQLCNHEIMPPEEQLELARRWRETGDKAARDALERANYRLVVSVAGRYAHRIGSALTFLDLIQAGMIGLHRAAELFDPERGNYFTTYATYWIRQSVQREVLYVGKSMHLPAFRESMLVQIALARRDIEQEEGCRATHTQIVQRVGLPKETVERVLLATYTPLSLDITYLDFKAPLEEIIPSNEATPASLSEQSDLHERLDAALLECHELPARTIKILRLRFGLDDGREWSLDEIARRVGLTSRERVRQIITNEALPVLRTLKEFRDLYESL